MHHVLNHSSYVVRHSHYNKTIVLVQTLKHDAFRTNKMARERLYPPLHHRRATCLTDSGSAMEGVCWTHFARFAFTQSPP